MNTPCEAVHPLQLKYAYTCWATLSVTRSISKTPKTRCDSIAKKDRLLTHPAPILSVEWCCNCRIKKKQQL